MSTAEEFDYFDVMNSGLAKATPEDLEAARRDMAREQEWLGGEHRFATNQEAQEAYERGELVIVRPDDFTRPVKTLLEPRNFDRFQPYLRPGAAEVLKIIGRLGHQNLQAYGVEGEIRFPVTSMIRSEKRQAEIAAQPGKLALSPAESGHPTGWDLDIDSSSYYLWDDGEWKSVSRRNPHRQAHLHLARERILGAIAAPTRIAHPDRYDPRVRLALHYAVAELYSQNVLSPVVEYANTTHELIHIGVNPAYLSSN